MYCWLLQKLGQPIVERCKEAGERPAAFDEFGHSLQQIRKAVDLYHSKVDEVYIVSYILHTSLIILNGHY